MDMRSLQLMVLLIFGVLLIAMSREEDMRWSIRVLLAGLGGGLLGAFVDMIS